MAGTAPDKVSLVKEIMASAKQWVADRKAEGWTQRDFANELIRYLDNVNHFEQPETDNKLETIHNNELEMK